MSYGPPPPRTPYGDQDFIKEDFTPQSQAQQNFVNANSRVVSPNVAHQGLPQQAPYGQGLAPAGGLVQPSAQNLNNAMQYLTPEDRIFLRSWRQDSFYYGVLPIAAVGSGALYYYNHLKNLPHKLSRYLMVSAVSYVVGKWCYKGELSRRLETTPLNTPFIRALRDMTGVKPALASMNEFTGDAQDTAGGGWNASEPPFPPSGSTGTSGSFSQTPYATYGQYNHASEDTYKPFESDPGSSTFSGEPPKSFTSYEELRAKNRGLLQK